MKRNKKPYAERTLTKAADRTSSRRRRAGGRRNKAQRSVGTFKTDTESALPTGLEVGA